MNGRIEVAAAGVLAVVVADIVRVLLLGGCRMTFGRTYLGDGQAASKGCGGPVPPHRDKPLLWNGAPVAVDETAREVGGRPARETRTKRPRRSGTSTTPFSPVQAASAAKITARSGLCGTARVGRAKPCAFRRSRTSAQHASRRLLAVCSCSRFPPKGAALEEEADGFAVRTRQR